MRPSNWPLPERRGKGELALTQLIAFASWSKERRPPEQFSHHPLQSPCEKGSTGRSGFIEEIGHHARDRRHTNLLADRHHF